MGGGGGDGLGLSTAGLAGRLTEVCGRPWSFEERFSIPRGGGFGCGALLAMVALRGRSGPNKKTLGRIESSFVDRHFITGPQEFYHFHIGGRDHDFLDQIQELAGRRRGAIPPDSG